MKKIENSELRDGVSTTASQVVSDSKCNVEHDAHIYFAQKARKMP